MTVRTDSVLSSDYWEPAQSVHRSHVSLIAFPSVIGILVSLTEDITYW